MRRVALVLVMIAVFALAVLSCADDADECLPVSAGVGWSSSSEAMAFRFDSTVSEGAREAIVPAADGWNDVTKKELRISFESDAPWLIQVRSVPPSCAGVTDIPGKVIALSPKLDARGLRAAAAHEMGHALRLRHLPKHVRGVMNPTVGEELPLPPDVVECEAVGSCYQTAEYGGSTR